MGSLLHDLRYAVRMLRKSPGFTAGALLTLALGIGINSAMFSVLNQVLLRPLPYPDPGQLVQVWETNARHGTARDPVSAYNLLDWKAQSHTLDQIAAYGYDSLVLGGGQTPLRVSAVAVSSGFFETFQVAPLLGRTFRPDEDQPDSRVVVLSYRFWKDRFAADPEMVGKKLLLNDEPYTVIGIMPGQFRFPGLGTDVWSVPAFDLNKLTRGHHGLFAIGRMKPGVTLQAAQSEMDTIARRLAQQYAINNKDSGVRLIPLHEEMVAEVKPVLEVLAGAVVLVLMIACANVAGLLLARTVSRQREIAIRAALGGSRMRLLRQLLTESVLLAIIGGVVGLVVAQWAGHFLTFRAARAVPRLSAISIDRGMLLFTLVACVLTGIVFGVVPSLSALRMDLSLSARESGWGVSQASGRIRLRRLLVVSEIGLALVLLVSAGLLTRALWRLQHVDPGFNSGGVLSMRISVPEKKYPNGGPRAAVYENIVEHLMSVPGVEAAGATNDLPFAGSRSGSSFEIPNRPAPPGVDWQADYRNVSPGYIETMRIPLVAGRTFTIHDNREAPGAAIVNQAFVDKFLRDVNPLGQHVKSHDRIFEIVGVVRNVKHDNLAADDSPELYVPQLQVDVPSWTFFAVRSSLPLTSMVAPVRKAVAEVVSDQPVYSVQLMQDRVSDSLAPETLSSVLLGTFAALALVLALIGIYGVVAYMVAQRTREIGIRMALGAGRSDVLAMILKQGAVITLLGIAAGAVAALLAARILSSMIAQVRLNDPLMYLCGIAALALISICATLIPARRATQVDPMVALRYE